MKFTIDMKGTEVREMVGSDIWVKMAKILRGQTGALINGEIYFYNYDLQRAYDLVVSGGDE